SRRPGRPGERSAVSPGKPAAGVRAGTREIGPACQSGPLTRTELQGHRLAIRKVPAWHPRAAPESHQFVRTPGGGKRACGDTGRIAGAVPRRLSPVPVGGIAGRQSARPGTTLPRAPAARLPVRVRSWQHPLRGKLPLDTVKEQLPNPRQRLVNALGGPIKLLGRLLDGAAVRVAGLQEFTVAVLEPADAVAQGLAPDLEMLGF